MAFTLQDTAHLIAALTMLLLVAHGMGRLLVALKQPRVVGEILGGLLLGPTVLPPFMRDLLFPQTGPTRAALGAIYQLGLLLLMFSIGLEMRLRRSPRDTATVLAVVIVGTTLPLIAGVAFYNVYDVATMMGPAQNEVALGLVIACAIAVTSTPVIGRIMADLGMLGTRFARIVLSSAVVEDGLLFVLLSFAFRLVGTERADGFGVASWIGVPKWGMQVWHVALPMLMLSTLALTGRLRMTPLARVSSFVVSESAVGALLVVMLGVTGVSMLLGVSPMLGALVAGAFVGGVSGDDQAEPSDRPDMMRNAKDTFRGFGNAFFGPIYFSLVGLRLDLAHDFDLKMVLLVLLFASAAKLVSVFLGARLAGEPRQWSLDLAIAMNARGAPGIALATAAFDARVINAPMQLTLVLLALFTSSAAGSWLRLIGKRLA